MLSPFHLNDDRREHEAYESLPHVRHALQSGREAQLYAAENGLFVKRRRFLPQKWHRALAFTLALTLAGGAAGHYLERANDGAEASGDLSAQLFPEDQAPEDFTGVKVGGTLGGAAGVALLGLRARRRNLQELDTRRSVTDDLEQ